MLKISGVFRAHSLWHDNTEKAAKKGMPGTQST